MKPTYCPHDIPYKTPEDLVKRQEMMDAIEGVTGTLESLCMEVLTTKDMTALYNAIVRR